MPEFYENSDGSLTVNISEAERMAFAVDSFRQKMLTERIVKEPDYDNVLIDVYIPVIVTVPVPCRPDDNGVLVGPSEDAILSALDGNATLSYLLSRPNAWIEEDPAAYEIGDWHYVDRYGQEIDEP